MSINGIDLISRRNPPSTQQAKEETRTGGQGFIQHYRLTAAIDACHSAIDFWAQHSDPAQQQPFHPFIIGEGLGAPDTAPSFVAALCKHPTIGALIDRLMRRAAPTQGP
ncbi:hypothetical protein Ddc_13701 [Ditylenchus destructor]|nr:hypothetical protein Ddc_13701 [Ditylenchus destructor]